MKKIFPLILLLLISCWNNNLIEKKITSNNEIESKTILTIWDSLTAWYSLDLEDSYPIQLEKILNKNWYNYEIINAWVSWDTSEQLLARIDLYIWDTENLPWIAIIVIWWNDWLQWKKLDKLEQNIEKIIKKLKEKNIKIVLWWIKIPPNLWPSYSNDFFKLYKKIADKNKIYLIEFILEGVAWIKNLNLNDWIHPNKQWYKIISQNVFKFLKDNNLIKND